MSDTSCEQVRAALSYVPPHERDTWCRMGMAVKSELGEDGFPIWDEWSQGADSYKAGDARAVWKSISPAGKVTIGTLFHEAKQRGWHGQRANGNGHTLSDTDRAELKERRRAEQEADAQRRHAAQSEAVEIWESSQPAPAAHAYLVRKGVQPHGLRMYTGERIIREMSCNAALVVPVRDSSGELHSLEFINAAGEKRFLPGGRKSGGYFSIGRHAGVIVIAEGFATGASVHEATGHATAVAFDKANLQPVAAALRAKYPQARIIIAADDDYQTPGNPGMTGALKAAAEVSGLVAVTDFGADRRDGASDFNDMMLARGADAVRMAIEAAKSPPADSTQIEPEPLRRPVPPAAPYPIEALGPILGSAASRIHEAVKAPAAMVGQSLLAAASLAVQHLADVLVDGRRQPLSLWCMTVGASGERKSAVDHEALQGHREHERIALDAYKIEMQDHARDAQAYEAAERGVSKGKDFEHIAHELQKLGPPPQPPPKPLLIIGSPTIEGVHKQFMGGLPSLGLFNDDAGEFIGGHGMSPEHRVKTASGMSRLWDVGAFDRVRAGDGAEKHSGKRLALHLMLQPVIAETVLGDDVLTGQGFLARCLMTWPSSTIGTRSYLETDLTTDSDVRRYGQRCRDLLAMPAQLREGTKNELEPRALTLTPDAKRRWIAIHDTIEEQMADRGEYTTVRAWASKAPSQILRVAAVLTLVESPNAAQIELEQIDQAAQLVDHSLFEAVRIVGTNSVPRVIRNAQALLDWCHESTRTELHSGLALQLGPNCIRSAAAFKEAIGELERCGWAHPLPRGTVIDGRRRQQAWTVEPAR